VRNPSEADAARRLALACLREARRWHNIASGDFNWEPISE
jgi:hypothetical protein